MSYTERKYGYILHNETSVLGWNSNIPPPLDSNQWPWLVVTEIFTWAWCLSEWWGPCYGPWYEPVVWGAGLITHHDYEAFFQTAAAWQNHHMWVGLPYSAARTLGSTRAAPLHCRPAGNSDTNTQILQCACEVVFAHLMQHHAVNIGYRSQFCFSYAGPTQLLACTLTKCKFHLQYLGMYVHGDNIVEVNHAGALCLTVTQQAIQLKEIGSSH